MKVGVIGAGTMGQGIAKAFAQVDGYEVALCDIKQEWAEGGKDKIAKGYARLVTKGKMTQEAVDAILAKITPGVKEDLCADCDLIVEAAFEERLGCLRHLLVLEDLLRALGAELFEIFLHTALGEIFQKFDEQIFAVGMHLAHVVENGAHADGGDRLL